MLLTQSLLDSGFTSPVKLDESYTIRLVKNIIERNNIIDSFQISDTTTLPLRESDISYNYISTNTNKQVNILEKTTDIIYPLGTIINIDGVAYTIKQFVSLVENSSPKELLCLISPVDINLDIITDKYDDSARNKILSFMGSILDFSNEIVKLAPNTIDLKRVFVKEYTDDIQYNKLMNALKINLWDRILAEIRYWGTRLPDNRFVDNFYTFKYCGTDISCTLYSFIFWMITDVTIDYSKLYIPYIHLVGNNTVTDYNTKISLLEQSNISKKFRVSPAYDANIYYEVNIKDVSVRDLEISSNSHTYTVNDLEILQYDISTGTSVAMTLDGNTYYDKLLTFFNKAINNN